MSLSADGNTAIVGAPGDNNSRVEIGSAGSAAIWARSGGVWSQQGPKLVASDADGNSHQGSSVSLSADGNTAIVGGVSGNKSVAWIWSRSSGVWAQQGPKLVGSDAETGAFAGGSVSLAADGNTAIVGGPGDNYGLGAAWIWTRSDGVWSQQGPKLVGSDGVGPSGQGAAVSLSADGNTAIVGGPDDNPGRGSLPFLSIHSGAAWIWTRSGGIWTQQGPKLVGSNAVGASRQGASVSLSADGNTAIVGGPGDFPVGGSIPFPTTHSGAAWVWTRSGGVWTQQGARLVAADSVDVFSQQGASVALSADGGTAIVGGPGDYFPNGTPDAPVGATWIWTRTVGVWTQQGQKMIGTGAAVEAFQGVSVALSADGNTAIVGGSGDDSSIGAAWVFARSSSPTPSPTPSPSVPPRFVESIPDQIVPQNGSTTVSFTVTGAVIASALRVSASSSNPTLLNATSLVINCNPAGVCALVIRPADGRAGSATVTLSVTDNVLTTTTTFAVTVPVVRPGAPAVSLANVVGSGIAVTWSASDTGPPLAYAVAWGTSSGASNLPTQLVPGTTSRLDLLSLPSGTYFFRVYAVGTGDISPPSSQSSAMVTTASPVPGPPLAIQAIRGNDSVTAFWSPPNIGATPTIYELQIGSTLNENDVASRTTTDLSLGNGAAPGGSYWARVRAATGGSVGVWSSSVHVPVPVARRCSAAPGQPTMLPVTTTSGQVTMTWWPGSGDQATLYQVAIAPGLGLPAMTTLTANGQGTSFVWGMTSGSFAVRVTGGNDCGFSMPSNQVGFAIP